MPREIPQPPRVLVLRLTLNKGGKKYAKLHLFASSPR